MKNRLGIFDKLKYYDTIYENGMAKVLSITMLVFVVGLIHVFFAIFFYCNKIFGMYYLNIVEVFLSFYSIYLILYKHKYEKSQYIMTSLICIYVLYCTYLFGFEKYSYLIFFPLLFAYFTISPVEAKYLSKSALISGIAFLLNIVIRFTVNSKYKNDLIALEYINIMISVAATYFVLFMILIAEKVIALQNTLKIDVLEQKASTDFLTGLYKKGFLEEKIEKEGLDLEGSYIILCDIDFFKKINDNYGHIVGDYVLKEISVLMTNEFRNDDYIIRWGGEEFLIIVQEINYENLLTKIFDFRKKLKEKNFSYGEFNFNIAMTFGLKKFDSEINFEENIKAVDSALYFGKAKGRDCIVTLNKKGEFEKLSEN